MTVRNKTVLKDYFQSGQVITQIKMGDFIDSTIGDAHFNAKSFGAVGDDSTDNSAALQSAIDALSDYDTLIIPKGKYRFSTKLTINKPVLLQGEGGINRWSNGDVWGNQTITQLIFTGTGDAIEITMSDDTARMVGLRMSDFELRPLNAGGGNNGIYFNATVGNTYAIYGVLMERLRVSNFGNDGIQTQGTVFDFTCRSCTFERNTRYGFYTDPIGALAGNPSQFLFDDCFLTPINNANSWAARLKGPVMRFMGGTVAGIGVGNGLWLADSGHIWGTNLEGVNNGIGVRYTGSLTFEVIGGAVQFWSTGVQIGDPGSKVSPAQNWLIHADITANTTDLHIVDGGNRSGGMVLNRGSGSSFVVTDDNWTIDGVLNWVYGARIKFNFTPASSGAAGTQGELAWDADYIYVCTATNTWKRVGIATW